MGLLTGGAGLSGLLLPRVSAALDADAATYIAQIELTEGQPLETAVVAAINNFIVGCKSDQSPNPGVYNYQAIKASCILAGARTLGGALVPLRGLAPTNSNFISADYSRITGLKGSDNTAAKQINTSRLGDSDPQNNKHMAVYRTEAPNPSVVTTDLGNSSAAGSSALLFTSKSRFSRINSATSSTSSPSNPVGFWGASRNNSAEVIERIGGVSSTILQDSKTPTATEIAAFARGGTQRSDARLSFYSVGESVDLALLDSRLQTLMFSLSVALT